MSAKNETPTDFIRTRYGITNPESANNPLWEQVVRGEWSGYRLAKELGITRDDSHFRHNFALSSYRETTPGPFWSWQRFGRTTTKLPDGRIVHVAGEHEDGYDPDFCIYNDVAVEHSDGRWDFFLYPKDIFPPTDFHTATLFGDDIILIGSLGYMDMRRVGETQILKLDTKTLRIDPIAASGEAPGWISDHSVEWLSDTAILVLGGRLATEDGMKINDRLYELDLERMIWRRRQHGDVSLFPIPADVYHRTRNPHLGRTNPERIDNPFWHEMARCKWPPSRARLHFGDLPSTDKNGRKAYEADEGEVRPLGEVVWTAAREDAVQLELNDGRNLLIGGRIRHYDDERMDAWIYNDVIVTSPDGACDVFTYPHEVFPDLSALTGVEAGGAVYLFGIFSRRGNLGRPRGPHVLRLDLVTYRIEKLASAPPNARISMWRPQISADCGRMIFALATEHEADPQLYIAFDLTTHSWSEPFSQDTEEPD